MGLPNPASVFCQEKGGQLQIERDAAGNASGLCVFPDGSQCEEWTLRFTRGCRAGLWLLPPGRINRSEVVSLQNWELLAANF